MKGALGATLKDESIRRSVCGIVGEDNVAPSSEAYAYAVEDKVPKVVAFPKDADDVSRILAFANESGVAVVPRGNGTKMTLGGTPKRVDVVLCLLGLNRIIEYEPADLVVTVEAGLSLAELQRVVAKNGQWLPLDPPYTDVTTLGGTVSSNSSGPVRYRFGSCRDLLLGVKVAAASGVVTKSGGKVVKNVAGYDLKKLYVGALGTLGVITELTFRLHPLPESEKTYVASFSDVKNAADLTGLVLGSELLPCAIEGLNSAAAKLVSGIADVQLDDASYVIAARFGDVEQSVRRQLSTMDDLGRASGASSSIVLDAANQEAFWNAARNLPCSMDRQEPHPIACKASVPISRTLEVCDAVERLASQRGYTCFSSSHLGNGIAHFYLFREHETQTASTGDLEVMIAEARDLTSRLGGTLVIETSPIDIWGDSRADFRVMRALKSQFDPRGTLSPGRLLGGA